MSIFGKLFFCKMDDEHHHHPSLHLQVSANLTFFDFLTFRLSKKDIYKIYIFGFKNVVPTSPALFRGEGRRAEASSTNDKLFDGSKSLLY